VPDPAGGVTEIGCFHSAGADWQERAAGHVVHHDRGGGVPGGCGGGDSGVAAGLDPVRPGRVASAGQEERDEQDDLGDFEQQEHGEHGPVDPGAPQQHVGVEDREPEEEPAEVLVEAGRAE
jgi:hypothetical protein